MKTPKYLEKFLYSQDSKYDSAEDLVTGNENVLTAYEQALSEIKGGAKRSHWMWFVFPQIKGLGYSGVSRYYEIKNLKQAKAYLKNETLRSRLIEISEALLGLKSSNANKIMGYPDNLKLKSSMTLFAEADPSCSTFQAVLDKFYNGKKDDKTLKLIDIWINPPKDKKWWEIADEIHRESEEVKLNGR